MRKNIVAFFLTVILSFASAAFAVAQTDAAYNFKPTADKKLKIIKKPFPKRGECRESSGLSVIRVTFDKSGTIAAAEIFKSSGCDNFDSNSLAAARAIKFEPQIENGEAVTVKKQIEYTYRRF